VPFIDAAARLDVEDCIKGAAHGTLPLFNYCHSLRVSISGCRNVSDCLIGPIDKSTPACRTKQGNWQACAALYARPQGSPASSSTAVLLIIIINLIL
jgi:hypothetical protein